MARPLGVFGKSFQTAHGKQAVLDIILHPTFKPRDESDLDIGFPRQNGQFFHAVTLAKKIEDDQIEIKKLEKSRTQAERLETLSYRLSFHSLELSEIMKDKNTDLNPHKAIPSNHPRIPSFY
ncbi:MAG: hypothetical protein K9G62_07825 [Alphaproteobacteria bacterium]|nr:hypothetical protein [Alphaproteobacteria bacterium]